MLALSTLDALMRGLHLCISRVCRYILFVGDNQANVMDNLGEPRHAARDSYR